MIAKHVCPLCGGFFRNWIRFLSHRERIKEPGSSVPSPRRSLPMPAMPQPRRVPTPPPPKSAPFNEGIGEWIGSVAPPPGRMIPPPPPSLQTDPPFNWCGEQPVGFDSIRPGMTRRCIVCGAGIPRTEQMRVLTALYWLGHRWLTQHSSGFAIAHFNEPIKEIGPVCWEWESNSEIICVSAMSVLDNFVKYNDPKPLNIAETLRAAGMEVPE